MQILTDLKVEFTLADVWASELGGRAPNPSLLKMGEEVYAEAVSLIAPAALFDLFPVGRVMHNRIVLENGRVLRGADVSRFLAPARQVIVGMATLGPALEKCASRYFAQRERARGYLIDCIGTAALSRLVQELCGRLETTVAVESGYPMGFPISPGDGGWPLDEQRILFELAPAERIGVTLTDSFVMLPKKSISFVIGLGPNIQTGAEGSQCDYCSVRDTCRYRHIHARQAS
jgi:hypothetical protein